MLTITTLHNGVARIYYTYGLFCASHPFSIIIIVIISAFITCYPLSNLPLPSNTPIEHWTPRAGYAVPSSVYSPSTDGSPEDHKRPRWFVGEPVAYVQQIVLKSAVSPWRSQYMVTSDAFRAPLSTAFTLLQELDMLKIKDRDKERSLADICYRVSEPVNARHLYNILPNFSCLIISPANLWEQDIDKFQKDPEIIKTMFGHRGHGVEIPPMIRDLLFGAPWKYTGTSKYYIRNSQRVITYAIIIILKKYDSQYMSAMLKKLEERHPDTTHNGNTLQSEDIVHVHYKDSNYFVEYTPLLVTYLMLLLYLYFSVRKIEMVKSKFGLAISAVVTVVASLLMSVSICTLCGLQPTLNGGEIFPYLVVIIGVENVLVITKSVVSTPVHWDVKIRVAQGLSREGWSITKNLLTELSIMIIGFFTFVPAIQEFCAFALVGVLSDFWLQMAFFATVLSVDIRRMELSDLHHQSVQQAVQEENSMAFSDIQPLILCPVASHRSSHPPRYQSSPSPDYPASYSPGVPSSGWSEQKSPSSSPSTSHDRGDSRTSASDNRPKKYEMPRRVKFFYFLARFRIVQKLLMVCTVIWIVLILYKAGLVGKLTGDDSLGIVPRPVIPRPSGDVDPSVDIERPDDEEHIDGTLRDDGNVGGVLKEDELGAGLVGHTDLETWRKLSFKHWPMLFHYYNISLFGRYISILPTIHLSELIDPSKATEMRHPSDMKNVPHAFTHYSHQATYRDDILLDSGRENGSQVMSHYHQLNFYPKSQREFVITVCLCILSVIVITYFMTALYRCMCSRNYSRWRHSWARSGRRRTKGYFKQIKESVPLLLSGHSQNIECLLGDNGLIVSSCLGGEIKIWDSNSGDCINTITRKSIIPPTSRRPCIGRNIEDSDADLYAEYHGGIGSRSSSDSSLVGGAGDGVRIRKSETPTAHFSEGRAKRGQQVKRAKYQLQDLKPDLSTTINTEFSSVSPQTIPSNSEGYDFQRWFGGLYEEHRRYLEDEESLVSDLQRPSSSDNLLLPPLGNRSLSWSCGEAGMPECFGPEDDMGAEAASPSSLVWCLSCLHGLVVAGCGCGRVEVWEAETGELRYYYGMNEVGVTGLCVVSNKIVAARLDGTLDFLEMETFRNPVFQRPPLSPKSPRHKMGHGRNNSTGCVDDIKMWNDVIRCAGVTTCRAHQLPINCIQCAGGRIVTASQDHTLKVFRLDNALCLYTLHGHEGSVTALCLDQIAPLAAASGSVDGTVRIWDLLNGTCIHKFHWHEATVVTLTTSPLYIVSIGLDDRMCVWDRTKSSLLHTIHLDQGGVGSAALMSRNLIVTGGQGSISLWDIPRGSLLRKVVFTDSEQRGFVNHVVSVGNTGVVCDQGIDLKVVYFPTILEKAE